jgi:hypothetical protein
MSLGNLNTSPHLGGWGVADTLYTITLRKKELVRTAQFNIILSETVGPYHEDES